VTQLLVVAIIVASTTGIVALAQEAAQPAFRTGTTLVTLDVTVRRGQEDVAGLTAADFEVLDNGVSQAATVQLGESMPADVSLAFDQSAGAVASVGRLLGTSLPAIAAMQRPIDRLRVITFARDVREVVAMQVVDPSSRAMLPDLTPPLATRSLMRAGRPDQEWYDFRAEPTRQLASLFDAMLLALARPSPPGRRHVVVVFAQGVNSGGVVQDGALVEAVAARSDALLHAAFWDRRVTGAQAEGLALRDAHRWVGAAAAATGGAVHEAQDSVKTFKAVIDGFRHSYILQYTATAVPSGGWHTVTVRTPRYPQYTVRARRGYMGQ
jgi:VWFA-related protein